MSDSYDPENLAKVLVEQLRRSIAEGPIPPITDEEIRSREEQKAALEAQRLAEEQDLLQRSGMPDIETFNTVTGLTQRELFVLEMRTTPEKWALANPGQRITWPNIPTPKGADVELTNRERFIIATCMTPEAHAFRHPDTHQEIIRKHFPEGQSPYAGLA